MGGMNELFAAQSGQGQPPASQRGKRRLHKTPDRGEVIACRWWLDAERRLVRPRVIVAMGGTVALAVFDKPMPVLKNRGRPCVSPMRRRRRPPSPRSSRTSRGRAKFQNSDE